MRGSTTASWKGYTTVTLSIQEYGRLLFLAVAIDQPKKISNTMHNYVVLKLPTTTQSSWWGASVPEPARKPTTRNPHNRAWAALDHVWIPKCTAGVTGPTLQSPFYIREVLFWCIYFSSVCVTLVTTVLKSILTLIFWCWLNFFFLINVCAHAHIMFRLHHNITSPFILESSWRW